MSDITSRNDKSGTLLLSMMLAITAAVVLVLGALGVAAIAQDSSTSSSVVTTTVHATVSEFKIVLDPATVPAGDVVIEVHNIGSVEHNLSAKSLGKKTPNILSMGSATLNLGRIDAAVDLICEIAGHADSGMKATLKIGDSNSVATPTTAVMTAAQMDKAMEDVALKFPAKTKGAGNQELAPKVGADGVKEFALTASIIDWEVEPGVVVKGWAYNGQIPGPVIHVNVGDKVRIVLKNELPESTSMHLHGIRVPNAMDGVDPYTQKPILSGETFSYEFTALEPSVGMYHSHHDAQVQVPNGLAGALIIGDWKNLAMTAAGTKVNDTNGKAEQEVMMVLNDAGTIGLSLNGKSFPATAPYSLKVGETMVVHYFNEGLLTHPMHMHQPSGLVVARDGKLLDAPYFADTINVAPGERWTVVYTAQDVGVWAWHCHILTHAETPTGMKYMVTALIVK
ncbi:MAG: multicopper oxidase domain-containing protein [Actinomycetes bacterium]